MFDEALQKKFKARPYDELEDAIDFEKYGEGDWLGEVNEGTQGEASTFFLHKGSVKHKGPFIVGHDHGGEDEEVTVHVIDGDLTVDGPIVFQQEDAYSVLFVTGNVTCTNMMVAWDAFLFIGGSLTVKELFATYVTDAAFVFVGGALKAGSWLEAGDRGNITITEKPQARLLRVSESRYYVFGPDASKDDADDGDDDEGDVGPFTFDAKAATSVKGILHPSLFEGDEDIDTAKLTEAIGEGKPVFA